MKTWTNGNMKKYRFNMVEIALAMAILSIGLASILVLFTTGIGASRDAVADNNLADAAEFLMSHIRAEQVSQWIADSKAATPPATSTALFGTTKPTGENYDNAINIDDISSICTELDNGGGRFYGFNGSSGQVFLFLQKTTTADNTVIVDFAAVAKVWSSSLSLYMPKTDGTYGEAGFGKYGIVYNVELSWPAERPLGKRNTKTFRYELFNETAIEKGKEP
ncbi:MAG: hypothetical protein PHI35_08280 [Victivallaceae bacterium]|nr:hypothetical protein [Victivallaceae bacterium]